MVHELISLYYARISAGSLDSALGEGKHAAASLRGVAPLAAAATALGAVQRLAPPDMRRLATSLRACQVADVAGLVPADALPLFTCASSGLPPAKHHNAVRPCTPSVKIARVVFAPFVQETSTPVENAAATHASSPSTVWSVHAAVHRSAQGAVEFSSPRAAPDEASRGPPA